VVSFTSSISIIVCASAYAMNATLIIYATLIFFSTIGLKRGEYKVNYLNNAEIIDMGVVAANN